MAALGPHLCWVQTPQAFKRGPLTWFSLQVVVLGTHASFTSARRPMTRMSQRMRARARSTRRSLTLILRFRTEIRAPLACAPTYAQHCFLAHIDFHIGSGLAGIHDGGNAARQRE